MLKQIKFIAVLVLCLAGCKEEVPVVKLSVEGLTTGFVMPSGKFKIALNQPATIRTTAGLAVQDSKDTLVFTAPNTVGNCQIIVKNLRDAQDSLILNAVVSPKAEVFKALQSGGYSLVFRHTAADVGADLLASTVPNWWKMCDSNIARQLNEQGKKDAQKIGSVFKLGQIPIERIISSEFCRCFTTADLMGLSKTIMTNADLTFWVYSEANRYANTMKVANSQPIDNKNTVLVIHAGFSNPPTPAPLNSLAWGDAAVFKLGSGQTSTYITTLKVTDFTELIKN